MGEPRVPVAGRVPEIFVIVGALAEGRIASPTEMLLCGCPKPEARHQSFPVPPDLQEGTGRDDAVRGSASRRIVLCERCGVMTDRGCFAVQHHPERPSENLKDSLSRMKSSASSLTEPFLADYK